MTDLRETSALVALLRRGGRPWHQLAALVEESESAVAVLDGDYVDPSEGSAPTLFDPSDGETSEDLDAIAAEVRAWEDDGMRVVTVLDDEYPENLRAVFNRPPLLFIPRRAG